MIIGITGWTASGKDTVGDYLVKKGFCRFSFSDYLREVLKKEGIEINRDNLREKGNSLRKDLGPAFIAEKAVELIEKQNKKNWVLLSIRLPVEVETLHRNNEFVLLNIDVPEKIRYKRALERAKTDEQNISFESFIAKEAAERSGHSNSQEVDRVIEMADITIENSGTFPELYQKIDKLIENWK